ncbi:hypothetical protein [uncultured Paracoccus sp.]|uniref:hypothetical protein n=1 Tax=uncultured Paracoccus sp. TaxID=189685 RepID=UPI0025D4AA13|nr:hypothetical protein [uncultured Paracoccus sp.]
MGLVLKYVETTKSGSFVYRRRVPKAVVGIIGKAMFKKKLGDTEREALAAYPRYHVQVEGEIAAAQKRLAAPAGRASSPASQTRLATEREAYAAALRYRADLIEAGTTEEGLHRKGSAGPPASAQEVIPQPSLLRPGFLRRQW